MRKFLLLVLLAAPAAHAEILTLFSDSGIPSTPASNVIVYGCSLQFPNACTGGVREGFNGQASDLVPPEGFTSWKTTSTFPAGNEYAGWGISYIQPQDLSRFWANGELRFWIYSNTPNVKLEMKQPGGTLAMPIQQLNPALNQWVYKRIRLNQVVPSAAVLSSIENPFLFTSYSGPGTFYIDNVRFVDNTTSPIFQAKLCAMGDTACATSPAQVTWTSATPSSGWKMADQYIQLTIDSDVEAWGVQIYTNNRAGAANPQFIVASSSNPAGLVNTAVRSLTIPLAWSIKAGTGPVTGVTPAAANPNNNLDLNSFQWVFMKDAQTPNIPAENTFAFSPGELAVTVRDNRGIHYGQALTDFGAQNSPNYLFLESNFGSALAQQTYRTSTLTVEFFSL